VRAGRVRQSRANEDCSVYGTATQSGCFCHVLEPVRALLLLPDSDDANGRVFTVGSSTEVPIVELARRVIEHVRADSSIRFIPYEEAYDDGFEELGRRIPDTTALRNLTGWTPTRSVDEAIKDVIAYERSGLTSREVERIAG